MNFKSLSHCFEETIGFGVKASFASHTVSRLTKPGDITKKCQEWTDMNFIIYPNDSEIFSLDN